MQYTFFLHRQTASFLKLVEQSNLLTTNVQHSVGLLTNEGKKTFLLLPFTLFLRIFTKKKNMEALELQKNILYKLQDLPIDRLREIFDFVSFIRKKTFEHIAFEELEVYEEARDKEYDLLLDKLLNQRYEAYKANPESASTWEEVQERLQKKYNWS